MVRSKAVRLKVTYTNGETEDFKLVTGTWWYDDTIPSGRLVIKLEEGPDRYELPLLNIRHIQVFTRQPTVTPIPTPVDWRG